MASKQTEQLIPNLLLEELVMSSPKPKQYTLEASESLRACVRAYVCMYVCMYVYYALVKAQLRVHYKKYCSRDDDIT